MQRFNVAPAVAFSIAAVLASTACSSETPPQAEETAPKLSVDLVYDLDFVANGTQVTGDLSVLNAPTVPAGKVANMNVSLTTSGKTQQLDINFMHCEADNDLTAHVTNENGVNNVLTWRSSSLSDEIISEGSFPCKNGEFSVVNPQLTAERLAKWGTLPFEDWELQPEE